jgi:hypothetical protein
MVNRTCRGRPVNAWTDLQNMLEQSGAARRNRREMPCFNGGTAGTRTQDQSLKRALLYQLSYRPDQARMIAELGHQITANAVHA